jgi:hypothetical protein
MEIARRGRILIWEGASLWLMEALPAAAAPWTRGSGHTASDKH